MNIIELSGVTKTFGAVKAVDDLSLEDLIGNIVNPPFDKVGVFPLDTFYRLHYQLPLGFLQEV